MNINRFLVLIFIVGTLSALLLAERGVISIYTNNLFENWIQKQRVLIMAISLDSYFAFNNAAMTVKSQRLEVISANIANASTPNYKARDLDFSGLLRSSFESIDQKDAAPFRITDSMHIDNYDKPKSWNDIEAGLTYYVPLSPSLDNNTVEIGVEQARYGRAVVDYQASVQFLENKISGLRKALRGE